MGKTYEYKGTIYTKKSKGKLEVVQKRKLTAKQIVKNMEEVKINKEHFEKALTQCNEVLGFWEELYKLATE